MGLPNGEYVTAHGSWMEISGENGGIGRVEFDWCEEPNACCGCKVSAYEEYGRMVWSCDECGGGSAELFPRTPETGGSHE